ncbi:MAG: orotidine 5'-phosphate decarboxylase / HUMPS family protein [Anaerolineaceae bacterium]
MIRLENNKRYLQLAFNHDAATAMRVLPLIPPHPDIFIEAGTPYIKNEGMNGVRTLRRLWKGVIVADLKTTDGAAGETAMAAEAGANAATVMGSCPTETLDLFIEACRQHGMLSMIDMLGVERPLEVMQPLKKPPDVVVIHRGRDEESTRGKVIRYRQVNKIRSKYDVIISAAGGVDLREARSAIFNGANSVVVNLVHPAEGWEGIPLTGDIRSIVQKYLQEIA